MYVAFHFAQATKQTAPSYSCCSCCTPPPPSQAHPLTSTEFPAASRDAALRPSAGSLGGSSNPSTTVLVLAALEASWRRGRRAGVMDGGAEGKGGRWWLGAGGEESLPPRRESRRKPSFFVFAHRLVCFISAAHREQKNKTNSDATTATHTSAHTTERCCLPLCVSVCD